MYQFSFKTTTFQNDGSMHCTYNHFFSLCRTFDQCLLRIQLPKFLVIIEIKLAIHQLLGYHKSILHEFDLHAKVVLNKELGRLIIFLAYSFLIFLL